MMWMSDREVYEKGERVWVRGCRDSLIPGEIIRCQGTKAEVLVGRLILSFSTRDIMPVGDSESNVQL